MGRVRDWAVYYRGMSEEDVHIRAFDEISELLGKLGKPSASFFLFGDDRCTLDFIDDQGEVESSRMLVRPFDLGNDRGCELFKKRVAAILATYLGNCDRTSAIDKFSSLTAEQNGVVLALTGAHYFGQTSENPYERIHLKYLDFLARQFPDYVYDSGANIPTASLGQLITGANPATVEENGSFELAMVSGSVVYDDGSSNFILNVNLENANPPSSIAQPLPQDIGQQLFLGGTVAVQGETETETVVSLHPADSKTVQVNDANGGKFLERDVYVMVGVADPYTVTANDLKDGGWKVDWSDDAQRTGGSRVQDTDILALFSKNSRRDQFMLKYDLSFEDLTPELQKLLYPEIFGDD